MTRTRQPPLYTATERPHRRRLPVRRRALLQPKQICIPLNTRDKVKVMKFSPTRAPGRCGKARQAFGRRYSTPLSTGIVDKRETTVGSLVYRAFLQAIATIRAN
ncbi:MAG: hypothetical protein EPN38_03410 [Rhodanobacteraceae bacterium]|nr:MAG: hypothetical protein EPN38_03410 [Rhodanobacteraceae bacterium]